MPSIPASVHAIGFRILAVWIAMALFATDIAFAADGAARAAVPLSPPASTAIPTDALGDAIRRGQQIVTDTQSTVKEYVGNGLTCDNCHIDAGRTAYAAPFVGLTGLFPEYRARRGSVESLADRVDDCFVRSMNGKPLPAASPEMVAVLAYITWLSQGVPVGSEVAGRGFKEIHSPGGADPLRGKKIFLAKCAACHGADGQGVKAGPGKYAFPPLWGPQSFNDGAGMARESVAAAFIQTKMPLGNAGTLTDQEAFDVAAYVTTQPRPSYPPQIQRLAQRWAPARWALIPMPSPFASEWARCLRKMCRRNLASGGGRLSGSINTPPAGLGSFIVLTNFEPKISSISFKINELVPRRGLEPPRCYPLVPETSASTNSATWASGWAAQCT